ncbi:MAG TPA: hypothetical protein VMS65_11655 [Polyangiaceae bacterium]|nr:hypothetical protein [Polyangiaceae bacterium]
MRRSVSFGVSGVGFLIAGSLLVAACSGDGETGDRPDETGGSSGTGPTGGTSGTGTGGTSGSAGSGVTGGTAGSGGSGGTGGTDECGCTPVTTCSTVEPPSDGIINNFENLFVAAGELPENGIYGANDAAGMLKPEWWLGYFSGAYAYPDASDTCSVSTTPLTRSLAGGQLHVTGTVGAYSGFGTWMEQCLIDMSAYSGISFRIGGEVGPTGTLQLRAIARSNSAAPECRDTRGTCTAEACTPATYTVTVPSSPGVITVAWADFVGGAPSASVDPSEIWQFQWDFDWAEGTTPFAVDVTLDDVMLTQ